MLAQAIIGTAIGESAPVSPIPQGTFYFNDNLNYYNTAGGTTSYPKNVTVQYPDSTSGTTLSCDGNGYQMTPTLGAQTNIFLDFWFYPTRNAQEVLTMTGQAAEGGYTYNMMEIDSSNHVLAGVWTGGSIEYVTSSNTVTLNAWNHAFFYQYNGVIHLQINNGTAAELALVSPLAFPLTAFLSFGGLGGSTMGNSARFSGYVDPLYIWNSSHLSRYNDTKTKYGY